MNFRCWRKHNTWIYYHPNNTSSSFDCEWNDLLCYGIGLHVLYINRLCRDYDITPSNGDDLYIRIQLRYNFHSVDTIVGSGIAQRHSIYIRPT